MIKDVDHDAISIASSSRYKRSRRSAAASLTSRMAAATAGAPPNVIDV
ncbi:hypothetical protein SynA18461_00415 [Synechococcus sp. A18-46.1]|nr:hypothetical protein SynA18461_00415 [Synechococcus sp. A18-46.1]